MPYTSPKKNTQKIALAVLGAGYGRRFSESEDKLSALLAGKPIAHHILETVSPFTWAQKIVVCRESSLWIERYQQENFELIYNDNPIGGMLSSLKKAVLTVKPEVTHLFICLADMPFLSQAHLKKILSAFDGEKSIATQSENYKGPPALFALKDLHSLPERGEGGARSLLQKALFISCTDKEILDIDEKKDLLKKF